MIVAGLDFPDKCPDKCPGQDDGLDPGALCARCPLFCCTYFDDADGRFRLVDPDDFRADWAQEWRRWLDTGMMGRPYLPLERSDQ